MTDQHSPEPEHDDAHARLGGTEDAVVDERAEELRAQGIMPDPAAIRADDREGRSD